MGSRAVVVAAVLAAALALGTARRAGAAPAPSCSAATMAPVASVIPANLPAFAYSATNATAADVHLYSVQNGTKTELPLTVGPVVDARLKVAPTNPLVPGTTYELDWNPFCDFSPYPAGPLQFVASSSAPLPTSIGDLTSGPTFTSTPAYAFHVAATYTLADAMKAWAGVYVFTVWGDGRIFGSPKVDAAAGTLAVDVDGYCSQLATGTQEHSLGVRANLPFAPQLETLAATATFDCPQDPNPGAPPPSSTSPSGNTVVVTDQNQKKSGCAVETTSATTPVSAIAWGALGLLGLIVTRVRRRSSAATRRR